MMSSNQKYWTIFGCFLAAIAGLLLYLVIRPFSHKPEDGIEESSQTSKPEDMNAPNTSYDTTKRGYRNNNPLNIRISGNNWKGEIKPSQDKSFCQFISMAYGFRAAMCCIRTYIRKYNCYTLQQIINRWAPWGDGNNPVRYADRVMNTFPDTFPSSDTDIDYNNREQMTRLVYAMAIVENGSAPVMADCETAFNLM